MIWRKISKSFTQGILGAYRIFFQKMEVAENSLSEPFKDIFTNHFKIVDFCTDYWDWYLVFHPSWCPGWKALIWCTGECSSVPYFVLLNQKPNYHKKRTKIFEINLLIMRSDICNSCKKHQAILQNTQIYTQLLTISCFLWDLQVYYRAQKTCYCTIFEPDESSQHYVSLRFTLIQSFYINLNPFGGVSP